MTTEDNTIQVNFSRALPLFPLDQVTLLPQQVLPLHIFEPRYRQMVSDALDGAGQIAMAVFQGKRWKQEYHGRPPVRPAACIGHIAQHEKLPDGRYNLVLRGVCRARVISEVPASEDRLYREAMLEPIGLSQDETPLLTRLRTVLETRLDHGTLKRLAQADTLLEFVRDDDIPTTALLELISFTLVEDKEKRYCLLEEGDPDARARIVDVELKNLDRLIRMALPQVGEKYPRGYTPN
ncbi:MAG: LON peptidase substrate-binding domain-containing protein [Phycisphaeraceae bacterium]|nr:LON peptidase substrate-binding domain-containing protein [Phycisphaeraceae bacterium]